MLKIVSFHSASDIMEAWSFYFLIDLLPLLSIHCTKEKTDTLLVQSERLWLGFVWLVYFFCVCVCGLHQSCQVQSSRDEVCRSTTSSRHTRKRSHRVRCCQPVQDTIILRKKIITNPSHIARNQKVIKKRRHHHYCVSRNNLCQNEYHSTRLFPSCQSAQGMSSLLCAC